MPSVNEERTPLLPERQEKRAPIIVFLALYFGVFVAALDGTIVTALLSHIASELNELPRIQWIATGYLISSAAFQPLYGKLSDIFGRKSLLLFCNSCFALGCLMCGMSQSLPLLITGRIVSGVGGGGMLSLSTIAVSDMVSLRQRGVFQGFGNIAFGLGAGIGGVFGGVISSVWGWRAAFNCQVPAVIVSTVLVFLYIHEKPSVISHLLEHDEEQVKKGSLTESLKRLDVFGSITLVSSIVFLMLAITEGGRSIPWTHPLILGSLAISVIFAGLFIYVEINVAKEPTLPMGLFKHQTIIASSLTNLLMTMSVYAILFYFPMSLTALYDLTPTEIGQRLTSNFVGVSIGSFGAGIYMRKTGKYFWLGVLSPLAYLVGSAVMVFEIDWLRFEFFQFGSLFLNGLGYASMLTVTLLALIAAVPHEFQAVTTSIQYTFRGIGSTLGVSIASSIFQSALSADLGKSDIPHKIAEKVLNSVEAIRKVPVEYQPRVLAAYSTASLAVFVFAFVLAVLATASSAMMKEHKLHSSIEREE